jgi:hypothetical protein
MKFGFIASVIGSIAKAFTRAPKVSTPLPVVSVRRVHASVLQQVAPQGWSPVWTGRVRSPGHYVGEKVVA